MELLLVCNNCCQKNIFLEIFAGIDLIGSHISLFGFEIKEENHGIDTTLIQVYDCHANIQ